MFTILPMFFEHALMFVKKNLKINMLKIKNIIKLGTIAIVQGDVEVLCIAYVF